MEEEITIIVVEDDEIIKPRFDCSLEIDKYKCYKCFYATDLLKYMKTHCEQGHMIQDEEEACHYICANCDYQTFSRFLYARHIYHKCKYRIIHKPLKLEEEESVFLCDNCGLKLNSNEDLEIHQKEQCDSEKIVIPGYVTVREFPREEPVALLKTPEIVEELAPISKWTISKPVVVEDDVEEDNDILSLEKKFKCDKCPSMFRIKEHLDKHVRWIHAAPGSEEWKKSHRCKLVEPTNF